MNTLDRSRQIARVFSRPVLEGIARTGAAGDVVRELAELGVAARAENAVVGDIFDASLAVMEADYRCEYVYKAAIANRIVFGRHSPRTSSLAIELGVGNSIVDAAVFNGTSTAYEIKTEFDSHRRLTSQTKDYLRAFDRVYLVTHPALAQRYAALIDERVGVLCLTDRGSLTEFRAPVRDVSRVEPEAVFRMLRQQEFMDAAQAHFGPQPVLPNGLLVDHYAKLFDRLTSQHAHDALVGAMRARTSDEASVHFVRSLPKSMRALGYATPLTRPQRQRVLEALAIQL